MIEQEALKSEDPWEQLILGCYGFIKGANTKECRRILLVDAPAVIGWDAWRNADQENSMSVLQDHIDDLNSLGFLREDIDTQLMTCAISGALNELALNFPISDHGESKQAVYNTITRIVDGFRKK